MKVKRSESMYYNECPYCGANLDPCEKCDCRETEEKTEENKKENEAA